MWERLIINYKPNKSFHGPIGIGDGVLDTAIAAVDDPIGAPVALAINFTKSSVLFDSTSMLCNLACRHSRRFSISAAIWLSEELARDTAALPSPPLVPLLALLLCVSIADAIRSARNSAFFVRTMEGAVKL